MKNRNLLTEIILGAALNYPLLPKNLLRESNLRFASENLKRCPLCGAVNARQNCDCFVCSWTGEFETHPEAIEAGLYELIERCPELAELLFREPTLWERIKDKVSELKFRFFRRRVDQFV